MQLIPVGNLKTATLLLTRFTQNVECYLSLSLSLYIYISEQNCFDLLLFNCICSDGNGC
jgi:hypothetical protein